MAHGVTVREIALTVGIARSTVREHLRRARDRLEARSTCHAVALAITSGEVQIADVRQGRPCGVGYMEGTT